ncbi:polysaccharide deacetylase family protein [Castellaniella caeni]
MAHLQPISRFSRFMARHTQRQWLALGGPHAIISITFDDILASAAQAGARILEAYGCRGTFYVAGALTAGLEQGRPTHTLDSLRLLRARGHEIASHGWGHIDYTRAAKSAALADLRQNAGFLHTYLATDQPPHFAYPFGRYDLASKRLTRRQCGSARILGHGVHRGRADLHLLGCERFYGPGRKAAAWQAVLHALKPGDWLIISTHEVEDTCGPYGCTPDELTAFIQAAQQQRHRVLPVGEAIDHFTRLNRAAAR